jgi:hypothetical protein
MPTQKETEYANLRILQGQVSSLGGAMANLEKKMDDLPGILAKDFRIALDDALKDHVATCPVVKEFSEIMRTVGRVDEVSTVIHQGELTSRQRRENARNTPGSVSISPEGVRIPWRAIPVKWIVAAILAALTALGIGGTVVKSHEKSSAVHAGASNR